MFRNKRLAMLCIILLLTIFLSSCFHYHPNRIKDGYSWDGNTLRIVYETVKEMEKDFPNFFILILMRR